MRTKIGDPEAEDGDRYVVHSGMVEPRNASA